MEKKGIKMAKQNYWLPDEDYRVTTSSSARVSNLYLTVSGIVIQRLKSIGQFWYA